MKSTHVAALSALVIVGGLTTAAQAAEAVELGRTLAVVLPEQAGTSQAPLHVPTTPRTPQLEAAGRKILRDDTAQFVQAGRSWRSEGTLVVTQAGSRWADAPLVIQVGSAWKGTQPGTLGNSWT